jgi:hypothetical protein
MKAIVARNEAAAQALRDLRPRAKRRIIPALTAVSTAVVSLGKQQ